MELLLASNNKKKLAELERLLGPLGVRVRTPRELSTPLPEVDEDRDTFAGNAAKKALSAAAASGLAALADDSGLCVDALGGAPGVRSARFAGGHGDDAANNALLLERLAGLPPERRGARFVCALALAVPGGDRWRAEPTAHSNAAGGGTGARLLLEVEGEVRGRILAAPRGRGGFGYDPLFQFTETGFAETDACFAELEPGAKGRVSHRGRALRELARRLPDVLP